MKRNASNSSPNQPSEDHLEWEQGDPVWDILDQASTREPNAFFARNAIRTARQLPTPSLGSRIISLFSSRPSARLALGAAACLCAVIGYQSWPAITPEISTITAAPVVTQSSPEPEPSTNLSELVSEFVIEETLLAAADDPTMFTRDEVVAMLGL